MYRSILVPLDGSPFGEQALPYAAGIVRRTGAALHLVHVHVAAASLGINVTPDYDEVEAQQRLREMAYLNGLAQRLSPHGELAVTTTLLDAPIAGALHDYVAASGIDLVVMSTHGRGALSRVWLGSVADRLIRLSPAPVLLVHAQGSAPATEPG